MEDCQVTSLVTLELWLSVIVRYTAICAVLPSGISTLELSNEIEAATGGPTVTEIWCVTEPQTTVMVAVP